MGMLETNDRGLQRVQFQIPAACVYRLELDGDTCQIEEGK